MSIENGERKLVVPFVIMLSVVAWICAAALVYVLVAKVL